MWVEKLEITTFVHVPSVEDTENVLSIRCCCALHEASQGWQVDYFFCSYAAGVAVCESFFQHSGIIPGT